MPVTVQAAAGHAESLSRWLCAAISSASCHQWMWYDCVPWAALCDSFGAVCGVGVLCYMLLRALK
jgi:hypothetical protein